MSGLFLVLGISWIYHDQERTTKYVRSFCAFKGLRRGLWHQVTECKKGPVQRTYYLYCLSPSLVYGPHNKQYVVYIERALSG